MAAKRRNVERPVTDRARSPHKRNPDQQKYVEPRGISDAVLRGAASTDRARVEPDSRVNAVSEDREYRED